MIRLLCLLLLPLPALTAEPEPFVVQVNGYVGYIDHAGKVVVKPRWDDGRAFADGLAPVETGVVRDGNHFDHTRSRWGFVDRRGELRIPAKYEAARAFHEGRAAVKVDRTWGYVDPSGALAIPATLWRAREFSEGRAAVELSNDRWAYIDRDGKVVFHVTDADMSDPDDYAEGLVKVRTKTRSVRYHDLEGKVALDLPHRFGRAFSEGRAAVRTQAGKWGFVDRRGALVVPAALDFAWSYRSGLAVAALAGRTGYLGLDGKMALQPDFEGIQSFCEGLAMVERGGKVGWIDQRGKLVIPLTWEDPEHAAACFRGGLAMVGRRVDGKLHRGYIDREGNVVWQPTR